MVGWARTLNNKSCWHGSPVILATYHARTQSHKNITSLSLLTTLSNLIGLTLSHDLKQPRRMLHVQIGLRKFTLETLDISGPSKGLLCLKGTLNVSRSLGQNFSLHADLVCRYLCILYLGPMPSQLICVNGN